jgi:diguanylate cyclase (GGDEF)-like protein
MIFQSRDILLILIASTSAVAAAAGIAARNFGAPRFAFTQILVLDFSFKINLLLLGWNSLVAASFVQSVLHLFTNIALIRGLRSLTIRTLEGEAASRALAARDPLTGLANRRGLEEAYGAPDGAAIAMLIDLDGFKAVNDRHGHAAGDVILLGVAARLREFCVGARSVCRLGGDEFVVLIQDLTDAESESLAMRLVTVIAAPYRIDDHQLVRVGASIGVARGAHEPLETLMARADRALYAAKTAGKGRVVLAHTLAPHAPGQLGGTARTAQAI